MADKKIIAVVGATGAQGGGLVRAILADPNSEFSVRAITRNFNSDKAKALVDMGAEVVAADIDDPETMRKAFGGAYGAFCVTFFWAHMSPEKELEEAKTMAKAAKEAGVQHVIWSTLDDSREFVPLNDVRMPTISEKYKVPHFDAKGEADHFFTDAGVPTTFLLTTFYWDNMIYFGMNPKRGEDGKLSFLLPMGDRRLAGVAAEDIGKCAYGIFKAGDEYKNKKIGIAGDHLTGEEMVSILSKAIGEEVQYQSVSPAVFRSFGFPGADDLGNMFQFYQEFEDHFRTTRDLNLSRKLNPDMQNFETWAERNKERIPLS